MYQPTNWLDDVPGIQTGTPMNAANFNNAEGGIVAANRLALVLAQQVRQHEREIANLIGEINTITLTNSLAYPFNNSQQTVALVTPRDTMDYRIIVEVDAYSGGRPGNINISGKALNGFKIAFDGSATSVTIKYFVAGGIYS